MNFFELLNISPGVTAVIGSGGKTSLLRRLGGGGAGNGAPLYHHPYPAHLRNTRC